jgi:polysaccharide biosynthesis protein, probable transporter
MNNTPSQKSIYVWNLLGNLAAAAVSVCFLIIISRFQTPAIADQYSLAISVGNLWVIIGLFQVRNYQATDIVDKFSFKSYYIARIVSTILMWITLYPYLVFIHYDLSSSFVISLTILILAYRTCDVWSDLYQGLFQQKSRLDIAGKSMFLRYLISVIILFVSLMIQKDLLVGFLLVVIFNIFFIFGFDIKFSKLFHSSNNRRTFSIYNLRQGFSILKDCFSLFIYGFLINLIFNEPRIIIAQQLLSQKMQSGVQRDFNILFMPVFFMSLCILVIRPLITSLAEKRQAGEMIQFYSIIKKIFVFLILVGFLTTLVSYLIGTPVLSLIFGVDLNSYQLELTILVFSGILYSIALVFENILTIYRKHNLLLIVYVSMYIVSLLLSKPLIISYGILGACISFMLVMVLYVIGGFSLYLYVKRRF